MSAVPEAAIVEAPDITSGVTGDVAEDARALLVYVKSRVAEMTDELADARSGGRDAKIEAEGFQIQARAGVLADYTRSRVAAERGSWLARLLRSRRSSPAR